MFIGTKDEFLKNNKKTFPKNTLLCFILFFIITFFQFSNQISNDAAIISSCIVWSIYARGERK